MKDRIVLSRKQKVLFTIPVDQLKMVTGGGGIIIQGGVVAQGIGTSPSEPELK